MIYRITVRDETTRKPIQTFDFVGTEDEMEKYADKVIEQWPDTDVKVDEVNEPEGSMYFGKDHPLTDVKVSLVEITPMGHRVRLLESRGALKRNDIVWVREDEWRAA